jgi:hypothetical protein
MTEHELVTNTQSTGIDTIAQANPSIFDEELIRKYPRANRRVQLCVQPYGLMNEKTAEDKGQTTFISPYGIEFQGGRDYSPGTLLKISVTIPNYWTRKQRFVEYTRVDAPDTFRVLAKVLRSEDIGKRAKKKLVTVETVNMDEVDEKVLRAFLQEG